MTPEAQKILDLLENYDPTLDDEINARVWCYVYDVEYVRHERQFSLFIHCCSKLSPKQLDISYTTSLDAQQDITPDDWETNFVCNEMDGFSSVLENKQSESVTLGVILPTEHLARLHAIIQAIDYKRENNESC